jgi:hypothetical protein
MFCMYWVIQHQSSCIQEFVVWVNYFCKQIHITICKNLLFFQWGHLFFEENHVLKTFRSLKNNASDVRCTKIFSLERYNKVPVKFECVCVCVTEHSSCHGSFHTKPMSSGNLETSFLNWSAGIISLISLKLLTSGF